MQQPIIFVPPFRARIITAFHNLPVLTPCLALASVEQDARRAILTNVEWAYWDQAIKPTNWLDSRGAGPKRVGPAGRAGFLLELRADSLSAQITRP